MKPPGYGTVALSWIFIGLIRGTHSQCKSSQSLTFARWSGLTPAYGTPVFVYTASGEEDSLTGVCLARCRELSDCAAVAVEYTKGSCYGVTHDSENNLKSNSDAAFFVKTCLEVSEACRPRWWAVEVTPGYHLHSEGPGEKVVLNTSVQDCCEASLASPDSSGEGRYRSAQWVAEDNTVDPNDVSVSDDLGSCILHETNKFTEPESYRVANFRTVYIESQCRHDYPKKIDRCSYEEYYNQTLKHVELTLRNSTRDMCKSSCEAEDRFICRGFTWTPQPPSLGLCDLHSEDLVTTGSWLLRRTNTAVYYRRVICLNISVECEDSNMLVTYRPRGAFRGRLYVPGRGEQCGARGAPTGSGPVELILPLYGDCDVHFAFAVSNGPNGVINRTMAYAMLMVQNNPIIQTAGDRWVRVGCSPGARPPHTIGATVAVTDTGKPSLASEPHLASGIYPGSPSAVFSPNTAPLTMYAVRADGGPSGGALSLGEPLELRIETTEQKEIEAYHLVASSRLGDSSVLLLDSRGCPTGQVDFPPFHREWVGGTQRLTARFKAFRFPSSHLVRFSLMVRFCENQCQPVNCTPLRNTRQANETETFGYNTDGTPAAVMQTPPPGPWPAGVVAAGGRTGCGQGGGGKVPLELEVMVGSRDIMSADTLIHADSRQPEEDQIRVPLSDGSMVCIHELLLVALALAWLAVQVCLLLGCCVLVNRYRNLAEMNMQKDYQSFDNGGFETGSTHRRVHWPDQHLDTLHS